MHAIFFIEMIDMAIGLIGNDYDKLHETLLGIGKKHVAYGVKPEYFPFMTLSITHMMQKVLGSEFMAKDQAAWDVMFGALIKDIVAAQNQVAFEEAVKNKTSVIKTWNEFGKIKDFEEVGGIILFQQ